MGTLAPLKVRSFGRLLTAYTVNEIGDALAIVALAVLVHRETGSAMATTALFVTGKFLPAFVSPLLTARLDQAALRRSVPLVYFAEAIVFLLLAVVADAFILPLILALALLDGTIALTGRSLLRAGIAGLLEPKGLLREGNGLTNFGFAVAAIGGSAAGGLLVAGPGVPLALVINAVSFAAAGVLVYTAREIPHRHVAREPFWARFRGGLEFVRSNRLVRGLLVGQAAALFFFTLAVPIEVVYVKETLHAGDAAFGLLMAAWGAGMVLGSSLYLVVRRQRADLVVLGATAAVGIGYVGMSAVDTLQLACVFAALGGTGNGIQWVSVMTLLQESTPDHMQARVIAFLESLGAAVPGLGFLAGGVIASITTAATALAVAGGGVLAIVAVAAVLGRAIGIGRTTAAET